MNESVKGYTIDYTENTITMNYKFAAAAAKYGTAEYNTLKAILADYPQMKQVIKAGRTIKTTRPTKRLTYENMKKYMSVYSNADELLAMFQIVKTRSLPLASPYKYVRDWFTKQFPNYKIAPEFGGPGVNVAVVEPPNVDNYKKKPQEAA